jgi:hypothetical protein
LMYDVFLTVHSAKTSSADREANPRDLSGVPPQDSDIAFGAPPCMGTFPTSTATITLQQSQLVGVPWGVQLNSIFSYAGTVAFTAAIWANSLSNRYNGYQEHQEAWDYLFHGSLPIPFQLVGGGQYSLKAGDQIHFGFNWHPISDPADEHSAVVDCIFFDPNPDPGPTTCGD